MYSESMRHEGSGGWKRSYTQVWSQLLLVHRSCSPFRHHCRRGSHSFCSTEFQFTYFNAHSHPLVIGRKLIFLIHYSGNLHTVWMQLTKRSWPAGVCGELVRRSVAPGWCCPQWWGWGSSRAGMLWSYLCAVVPYSCTSSPAGCVCSPVRGLAII